MFLQAIKFKIYLFFSQSLLFKNCLIKISFGYGKKTSIWFFTTNSVIIKQFWLTLGFGKFLKNSSRLYFLNIASNRTENKLKQSLKGKDKNLVNNDLK